MTYLCMASILKAISLAGELQDGVYFAERLSQVKLVEVQNLWIPFLSSGSVRSVLESEIYPPEVCLDMTTLTET